MFQQQVLKVVEKAWKSPFKLQSDFAREYSTAVAAAASAGFITTEVSANTYGRKWYITFAGMQHLMLSHRRAA